MVYETAIEERHSSLRSVTHTLLLLATGVFLGIMLAELREVAMDSDARAAFEAQPIAGEDWHGNVRRSTP
ncbi:hypothetical protein [uncultured Roseobacter sp.]|uniref:hypothetical protein n=1 Tax=uncultured Roseobacter sp. TaxID=114847 RepID=UPI002617207D|nr:hypothetical protein [uncultured Roseobacter sp.]